MLKWITAALVLAAGSFVAWDYYKDPRVTIRYRITLDFEVDGRPVSGSSVMEVTVVRGLSNIGAPYGTELRGEAITVDLGRHGLLFGILRGQPNAGFPFTMMAEQVFARANLMPTIKQVPRELLNIERVWRLQRVPENTGKIELLPNEIPQLVRFRDIDDQATVEFSNSSVRFESLGAAVRFVRAALERTYDPLTAGISARIGWWDKPNPNRRLLSPGVYIDTTPESHRVSRYDFARR